MIRLLRATQPASIATEGSAVTSEVTPAAAAEPDTPSVAYAVAWILAALGIAGGVYLSNAWNPPQFAPKDGFSALALFLIVAQAIERLIEPFTGFVKAAPEGEAPAAKKKAEANRDLYIAAAYVSPNGNVEQENVQLAAKWHAVVKEIRANTKIYAWGVSTMLGALASGALGLYLLRAVGAGATPVWLDVIITGVIIGGGSKALHDLLKGIETRKEKNEDPPEAK